MNLGCGLGLTALAACVGLLFSGPVAAEADVAPPPAHEASDLELAKKLANPVSSLISLPFQSNWDCCYGPEKGGRYTLNVQPVVPMSINKDWTLIVRTILPVIDQEQTVAGQGSRGGFGDVTQSFFFSPPERNGFTFAAGPVFLWPVGTGHFSSAKWAAGPTFVALDQHGPWTVGLLANHLWSYAGASGHPSVNATFVQPFLNYNFPDTTGLTLNTETSYNWVTRQWTVPINAGVTHLFKVGGQRIQLGILGRAYAVSPQGGPDWGVRFVATLLFPRR